MPRLAEVELAEKATVDAAAMSGLYFKDYCEFVHGWKMRKHQEPMFTALQQLADGTLLDVHGNPTTKLMVLMAPGFGKTDTLIEYNAWTIGRSIEKGEIPQLGYVSYADDVATLRSLAIRNTIEFNEAYKMVFPFATPDKNIKWASHEWFLERSDPSKKDPTLRASGLTGQILSYRFPTMITVDDPHDPKNVKTPAQRDEVWRIWRTTIRTRAFEGTPIALVCTRWSGDDLAGRLMETEDDWAIVHISALDTNDKSIWELEKDTGMGLSTKKLHQLRKEDKDSFLTQYMALPPGTVGDIFKWWTYGPRPTIQEVKRVVQAWDTGYTAKSYSSYSVMVEGWELNNGRTFIARVWRGKLEFPMLLDKLTELYYEAEQLWGDRLMVIVENKASGLPLVSMSGINRIKAQDVPRHTRDGAPGQQMDLVARAATASKFFETRHVVMPDEWTAWKDDYMDELREFSGMRKPRYDDQVSATLLLLEYVYPPRIKDYSYQMGVKYSGWNY